MPPPSTLSPNFTKSDSMKFYSKLYQNLCESRKSNSSLYGRNSGLHKHHIIPKHMGGTDEVDNLTYLSVREHIAAHFLLWKIHNTPNDLRSMNMLGAKLTSKQRHIVGKFCHQQKLGVHGVHKEQHQLWGRQSYQKALENGGNSFTYWASPEGRSHRASIAGTASYNSGNNEKFAYWASPEGRVERAKLGGAVSGKKPVTNGIRTIKLKTDADREDFLQNNPGWRRGHHWSTNKPTTSS